MADPSATPSKYRVVYVGTGRRLRWRIFSEPERGWRERLATQQEQACGEMAIQGFSLLKVVTVISTSSLQGGWTEGVWLYFESAE